MRKLFVFFCLMFSVFFCFPKTVHAEEINNFRVDAVVNPDGTVKFSELIVYDFAPNDRHGIYRTIPYIKTNSDGKTFKMSFDSFEVTDGKGIPYKFSQTSDSSAITLKIGDPNRTITGIHSYAITYTVKGAVTYFSDHDELYWNVTGNDWGYPIKYSSMSIHLPDGKTEGLNATCFTGAIGSKEKDCTVSNNPAEGYTVITSTPLPTYQGLSAVFSFPKGIVEVLEPEIVQPAKISASDAFMAAVIIIATLFWYTVLPIGIIIFWVLFGRDPKGTVGAPHVWFDVPKTKSLRRLTPAETGVVIDEQADMSDITATLIDLARRGYIKIVETKKNDFSLELISLTKKDDTLESFEDTFLKNIFLTEQKVRIKDKDFSTIVATAKSDLYSAVVTEGYFTRNPETLRTIFTVIAGIGLFTMNIPLAVVAFIFGRGMPKKTIKGVEAAGMANALKTFLKSQDKQLEFQAKNQMFFEKFLPYAVAFGVEKIWAERFKDINMIQPSWYKGYGNDPFTSMLFVTSLNSSMRSFSSAATPTRSSSGFSSGFSGGFSGGGGGGGGGGSW
jgi:uncharacterized membrane protein